MSLHGNMKREREREWSETSLRCIEHSLRRLSFDLCSFCSLCFFFFCRARRLTLIHIRILIHIQFFIVVAFVAFCFATRYVSCFANQQPPYPAPASAPLPAAVPFPTCSSMKMKGKDKSQVSQRILLLLGRWRKRERGKGRESGREYGSKRAKGVGFRLSITCNLNKLSVLWAFQFYALPPTPHIFLRSSPLHLLFPLPLPAPAPVTVHINHHNRRQATHRNSVHMSWQSLPLLLPHHPLH